MDSPVRPAPWLYDLLLALGVALILALLMAADLGGSDPPAAAYLWPVGFGSLMFVRRSHPRLVVWASVAGFFAYYASGATPIGVALPVAAAVYSAAEASRLVTAITGSACVLALSLGYRLVDGQDPGFLLAYDLPPNLALLAAAVALGDSVRARRELARHAERIAELTAERYRRTAEQRAQEERLAMSRDLHDSMGHALALISLHVQVAEEAGPGPDRQEALQVIRSTASRALADLRRTVTGLRRGEATPRHTAMLDDLPAAVGPADAAGIRTSLHVDVADPLPVSVQTAVYRVVQESITNVLRHSDADQVEVGVRLTEGTVHVRVADNGTLTPPAGPLPGHGLPGMRERVEALGGTFSAGRTGSGFVVRAELPGGRP